jgi:hypothetical protein
MKKSFHQQLFQKPSIFILFALVLCMGMQAQTQKPNIVFLLIDDLGYADCGFNGGKDILTPNIDKLAKEGAILKNHYVQPVCSPTRSALMTGRYPTQTGIYTIITPGAAWGLPLNERTLANALQEAGYSTAITGKWHLGEFKKAYQPNARGFDIQYGHFFGSIDYYTHSRNNQMDWYRNGTPLKEEGYSTHLVAKEACSVIEKHAPSKPLFLYVPFNGVHSPFQVPDQYTAAYPNLEGNRKKLAGMLAAVDEAVAQIVASLKQGCWRTQSSFFRATTVARLRETMPRCGISREQFMKAEPVPQHSRIGPGMFLQEKPLKVPCTLLIGIRLWLDWQEVH